MTVASTRYTLHSIQTHIFIKRKERNREEEKINTTQHTGSVTIEANEQNPYTRENTIGNVHGNCTAIEFIRFHRGRHFQCSWSCLEWMDKMFSLTHVLSLLTNICRRRHHRSCRPHCRIRVSLDSIRYISLVLWFVLYKKDSKGKEKDKEKERE